MPYASATENDITREETVRNTGILVIIRAPFYIKINELICADKCMLRVITCYVVTLPTHATSILGKMTLFAAAISQMIASGYGRGRQEADGGAAHSVAIRASSFRRAIFASPLLRCAGYDNRWRRAPPRSAPR